MNDRTQRAFYREWADGARDAGVSEADIANFIDEQIHAETSRRQGKCPDCGAEIRRRVDPRQFGPPELTGTWVNYWCSRDEPPGRHRDSNRCGYRVDMLETK